MLDKIEKLILNDAKKLAASNKRPSDHITKDIIKKQLPIVTKPKNVFQAFLMGATLSTQSSKMLQASYTNEFKSLFTEKQRKIMAKNTVAGILSIGISFIIIVLFMLYIVVSHY